MSRIDDLIQELCPDGVEFKELSSVVRKASKVEWGRDDRREFEYIDLSSVDRITHAISGVEMISSESAPSRAQQVVRSGDVIFGTTRPTLMRYALIGDEHDGQVASTGFCVLRADPDQVLPSFLFHTIGATSFRSYVEANERGASYPAIPDRIVKAYRVPLPPLEVQREIVRVLDLFQALEAELEAELEARRRQYEHYRDSLQGFDESDSGRWLTLGDVFDMKAGRFVSAAELSVSRDGPYQIPCYGGNGIRGYLTEHTHDGRYLLVGRQGALCGNVQRTNGKFYATEHAVVLTPVPTIDVSWAFHVLTVMNLNQYATKSAQPGLSVARLKRLPIPVPPLEEQQRIVAILDKFDVLVNDLSMGLPAELAARRNQYEHYRDRLLTFLELVA